MKYLIIILMFFVGLIGCKDDPIENPTTSVKPVIIDTKPKIQLATPSFNVDSAYSYVDKQVSFGPRSPNSVGHKDCGDWLEVEMRKYTDAVWVQPFTANLYYGVKMESRNIMGSFNPTASKRMVLAAHWDTRFMSDQDPDEENKKKPTLGADDGGSGVGVLLELARQLSGTELGNDWGVDIVFFDAEDQGEARGGDQGSWCIGAQNWSKESVRRGYNAEFGILLDMVGSKGALFPKEGYSRKSAGPLQDEIWSHAQVMGYNIFSNEYSGPIIDDHVFVNHLTGIPMVDIINLPGGANSLFGRHWHTHGDDMSIIDKNTLDAVGKVVTDFIFKKMNE